MATYVSNRDSGGLTDEEGHYKFWNSTFIGNVLTGQQVVQNSPSANLSVRVSEGIIRIPYSDYAYVGWSEGYTLVAVTTPDVSNPRIDRVIAYIDRSLSMTPSDVNNPGMLKYIAVAGTPNAVPSAPADGAVDTAVNNNPWTELAKLAVSANDTSIVTGDITDTRTMVDLSPSISAPHIGAPVGSVIDFAGSVAPSGYLMCYGQAISRTTYASLFTAIGTSYGTGDGSTTFNLPDCRGRVSAGKDNMGGTSADRLTGQTNGVDGDVLGQTGGEERHTLTVTELAQHNHFVNDPGHAHIQAIGYNGQTGVNRQALSAGSSTSYGTPVTNGSGTGIWLSYTGGNTPHNNIQPVIIFNKIIKY